MNAEWWKKTWTRLWSLRRREQLAEDFDDEIAFHLAMRAERISPRASQTMNRSTLRGGNLETMAANLFYGVSSLDPWAFGEGAATRHLPGGYSQLSARATRPACRSNGGHSVRVRKRENANAISIESNLDAAENSLSPRTA